jgi:hypothetical protein
VGPGLGDDVDGVVCEVVGAWDECASSDLGGVQFVSVGLVGGLVGLVLVVVCCHVLGSCGLLVCLAVVLLLLPLGWGECVSGSGVSCCVGLVLCCVGSGDGGA